MRNKINRLAIAPRGTNVKFNLIFDTGKIWTGLSKDVSRSDFYAWMTRLVICLYVHGYAFIIATYGMAGFSCKARSNTCESASLSSPVAIIRYM